MRAGAGLGRARLLRALLLTVAALLASLPAAAQDADPVAIAAEASAAYRAGDFARAIEGYERAYALRPEPTLLFNLGRCHEAVGTAASLATAIDKYQAYLRAAPEAADRQAVQRRVEALTRQLELLRAAERPTSTRATAPAGDVTPVEPPPAEPARRSVLPWILVGVGAAGVAVGGVLGAMAVSRHDEAVTEPRATQADALQGEAEGLTVGANVTFVAGGSVALAGLAWGLADVLSGPSTAKAAAKAVRVRPRVGPGSLGVAGSF